jgi:hypothetical protein
LSLKTIDSQTRQRSFEQLTGVPYGMLAPGRAAQHTADRTHSTRGKGPLPPSTERLRRRAVLGGALATGLPALSACGTDKPRPLPTPSPDVAVLTGAITAEESLIALYGAVASAHPALQARLAPMLAHHRQHLTVLRRHYRPGTMTGSPSPSPSPAAPSVPPGQSKVLAALRTAELQAVAARTRDLAAVPAALAQLFASISTCEAAHAALLGTPA